MTALAVDTHLPVEGGEFGAVPAALNTLVYEGAMVGESAGYGRGLVAGDRFRGHALEQCDNSTGAAGAKFVRVRRGKYRLVVTITGVAITDVGKTVYASDDATTTLTRSGNTPVGHVERYIGANTALVEFDTAIRAIVLPSAHSRTAVQLPTASILKNFDIEAMLRNPFAGSLLYTDFTHAGSFPDNWFVDATYAASAAGKTPTEHLYIGTGAHGELILFTTTDNQAAEGQWACPIKLSGGNPWAFGIRVKQSVITDAKGNYFAGLMVPQMLVGNLIADDGTLQANGSLGFQLKEGDGDKIDLVYDKTGQNQNEHDDDWCTPVADTYNVFELYCNGTIITPYLDGVVSGDPILAADIAAADFPAGVIGVPTFAAKAGHADDFSVTADWMYAVQSPA